MRNLMTLWKFGSYLKNKREFTKKKKIQRCHTIQTQIGDRQPLSKKQSQENSTEKAQIMHWHKNNIKSEIWHWLSGMPPQQGSHGANSNSDQFDIVQWWWKKFTIFARDPSLDCTRTNRSKSQKRALGQILSWSARTQPLTASLKSMENNTKSSTVPFLLKSLHR